MFCCSKQDHSGQIVNSLCLEQQCARNKNQLSCVICVEEQHRGHSLTTLKKILPQLIHAHRQKQKYILMISSLKEFIVQNFGQENKNGQNVVIQNSIQRSIQIMSDLKDQVQANNQEIYKMKDIFKNLNKNATQSHVSALKSSAYRSEVKGEQRLSPNKQTPANSPIKGSKFTSSNLINHKKNEINQDSNSSIDTFSHTFKHPYLSISPDCKTVNKSSHPGHRYSILSSKSLSPDQNQVNLKVDASLSGNIMIGLCHQSIVKDKEFVNNYGTNHGTYLIGQNGNGQTAISFHHSINMMNRKQIVGWNFTQGDKVTIGFNYHEEYIYFKLHGKKVLYFSMTLVWQDSTQKVQVRNSVANEGLKLIVLLQNVGDQVTLLQA